MNPYPHLPLQIKALLPPKFTTPLARCDRKCLIILATLLNSNINWRKITECIEFYKQILQCYSASKVFWSNLQNSWIFVQQRFICNRAPSITMYKSKQISQVFLWQGLLYINLPLWGRKILKKRCFPSAVATKGASLAPLYRKQSPCLAISMKNIWKSNPSWHYSNNVLSSFASTTD